MELVAFAFAFLAAAAALAACTALHRTRQKLAEIERAVADIRSGNGCRRILARPGQPATDDQPFPRRAHAVDRPHRRAGRRPPGSAHRAGPRRIPGRRPAQSPRTERLCGRAVRLVQTQLRRICPASPPGRSGGTDPELSGRLGPAMGRTGHGLPAPDPGRALPTPTPTGGF